MYTGAFLKHKEIINFDWNDFIKNSPQHSIYFYKEYLDIVCQSWEALVIKKEENCIAVLPLNISKKFSISYSLKPYLTQFLGPVCKPDLSNSEILNVIKLMLEMVSTRVRVYDHCFHPTLIPFSQIDFKNLTIEKFRSYELSLNNSLSKLYRSFSTSITNHIKKAKRHELKCVTSQLPEKLVQLSLDAGILNLKQVQSFIKLWNYIKSNQIGFILYIIDKKGNIHSGGAFVINGGKVTFICSATDNKYKQLGGNSLLIWEAIKRCKTLNNIEIFDFEGSMLSKVETYFFGFHPIKIEYLHFKINQLLPPFDFFYNNRTYIKRLF